GLVGAARGDLSSCGGAGIGSEPLRTGPRGPGCSALARTAAPPPRALGRTRSDSRRGVAQLVAQRARKPLGGGASRGDPAPPAGTSRPDARDPRGDRTVPT